MTNVTLIRKPASFRAKPKLQLLKILIQCVRISATFCTLEYFTYEMITLISRHISPSNILQAAGFDRCRSNQIQ